jgi:lipoate-protein ligase B
MEFIDLGTIEYKEAWELQKSLLNKRILSEIKDTVILCEHPEVITYGKRSLTDHLLVPEDLLQQNKIELLEVERGGDITWHGPGQLIAYPILDLNHYKRDVHWYMRQLEEVIIETLSGHAIIGERLEGKTGVWVKNTQADSATARLRKIASLGVKISRWCTMHGVAINVTNSLTAFDYMNPCGLKDIKMTSMLLELQESKSECNLESDKFAVVISDVKENFKQAFLSQFIQED